MKQEIYRATILLPLGWLFYTFMEPIAFCVPELNLYLDSALSRFLIVMATVIWLCCSPFRKSCCNGTWTEFLFNLVPVELILMVCFAQWKFIISVILTLLMFACETALFIELRKDEHRYRITKERHRMYKTIFRRCSVLVMSIICVVPCFLSLCVYGLQSPVYHAEQEIWERLFTEVDEPADANNDINSYYQDNTDLWLCFEEVSWKEWSIPEKITIMQELADFETVKLGIPSIPVSADMTGEFTLGVYNNETNEIWINTEHLAKSSANECIQTICHEVYHSLQHYLVSTLDWNNPALHTAYFRELQSWLNNQEDYKSAWIHGFDAYENQSLEVTAREYAAEETAKIMTYVKDVS